MALYKETTQNSVPSPRDLGTQPFSGTDACSYSGPAAQSLIPVTGTPYVGVGKDDDEPLSAYEVLADIAERSIEQPHLLPEAEIQILGAYLLGAFSNFSI